MRRPYTIVVAVVLIAILGAISLSSMTIDLLPGMNLPFAVVSTSYVGASPEEVEMSVTRSLEQSMATLSNIKNIQSISRENMSMIFLEFTADANMDSAMIEMRENLDMITAFMPDGVGTPVILKLNPDMMPIIVLSAAVEGRTIGESSGLLKNQVIPELESVEGVASVQASGLSENRIHVIIRDEKIDRVNEKIREAVIAPLLPPGVPVPPPGSALFPEPELPGVIITREMVSRILAGQNFSMPAGYISEDGIDYLVRAGDRIRDLGELRRLTVMLLPIEGIAPVVLDDVADILVLDSDPDSYTRVNGEDAIILRVHKQTDYSTSSIAGSVRDRVDRLVERNEGLRIIPLMDQGEYVDMVVGSIGFNLIMGGTLAILILLVFLRDFKPTIVVGIAIPVSLVTAFIMMYFSNMSLNIISMGGLALGVGMLVDNSIVVIENIYRMRGEGRGIKEAAVDGARQVAGAITASTLTTISVFLPLVFTRGIAREIFTDMGLTIAFSLLASLLIALTLVPMVASNIMVRDIDHRKQGSLNAVKRFYTGALSFSLNRKWIVVTAAVLLLAGSMYGAFSLGTEFFPDTDTGEIMVSVELPGEISFEGATVLADEVVDIIRDIDEVETTGAMIGGRMMGMGRVRQDSVSIYVLLSDDRSRSTSQVGQEIRDVTAPLDLDISVNDSNMDMAALSGGAISLNILGRDLEVLESLAVEVAAAVREVKGTVEVSDGLDRTAPELRIRVDKDKSIAYGLTVAHVFMKVNETLKTNGSVTTLSVGATDYDVIVDDEKSLSGTSREEIENLTIQSPKGETVAVKDIATLEEGSGFASIRRSNQQRQVTVTAQIAEGYNIGLINRQVENSLSSLELPDGYSIKTGGEVRIIGDSFRDLYLMLVLGVIFIYLIMVAQFQSLLSPFIVMFTIPLAFTGGFLALIITGNPVSIVAFIGLVILSGVVVNNAIVFVDYINILRETGMSKRNAIVEAGNVRLRPIIMTALTTVMALSFMSLGVGMGAELIQPMAVTAIGGLIYATLLTLLLVPVLYDAFNRKERLAGKDELPEEP